MLGVGTLFSYQQADPSQRGLALKYGIITEKVKREQKHGADWRADSVTIQWIDGGKPYSVLESDLIAMVKSGGPRSGFIYNTNERANCN